ncbi:MAG: hypothetical protein M4579_001141 [Chaenotheca gracillima]|nr:MAG: hypothetical protein M4579_001141 [Chaenotheca gracillima]
MVLQDDSASPAADEFSSDSSPSSDEDPYSSASHKISSADDSTITHPLPILGPLFGYSTPDLINFINRRIEYESKILKRPMSKDEASAIAVWTSKAYSMTSYGPPTGLALGLYRAYSTQATYKFPFISKNPTAFNPNKLWMLQGSSAQLGWHAFRWAAYASIGTWMGRTLAFSYALATRMTGEKSDKRLANLNKAEAEYAREVLANRRTPVDMRRERNAQPAAGSGATEGDDGQAQSNDGFDSDMRMQQNEISQQPPPEQSPTENRASTFQMDRVAPQPTAFDEDSEDASPTAPAAASSAPRPGQSESAWGRIRREANSRPNERPQRGQSRDYERSSDSQSSPSQGSWSQTRETSRREGRQGSTVGDGFAFSNSDEDKQLAKDEAQKDFDARIERERQGGDFGNDDRKRW